MRKTIAVTAALSLLLYPASQTFAATEQEGSYSEKHEVIYATLNASGEQDGLYVVNEFNVNEKGTITDYGNYDSTQNLSNVDEITRNDNKLSIPATEDPFYYRGDMNDQSLPWTFDVTYKLDGEMVEPNEIVGKSGTVTMSVNVNHSESAREVFTENFMVQVSATMNSDIFSNISAPDGTVASAGQDQQVSFTVMPGEEETVTLEAEAESFEFDGFSISALPASMSVEQPNTSDMTGDMEELSDGVAELHNGVAELNNGLNELNNGASDLSDGSASVLNGLRDLNSGSGDLVGGSESIQAGIDDMHQNLANQDTSGDGLGEMASGLEEIASGLDEASTGLDELRRNYTGAYEELSGTIQGIPDSQLSDEQLTKLQNENPKNETVKTLINTYKAAQTTKGTYQEVSEAFDAVSPALKDTSSQLGNIANELRTMAEGLNNADPASGLAELEEGLAQLSSEYGDFHSGLVDYTDGVGELANSYPSVHSGVSDLSSGLSDIYSGSNELRNGSRELRDQTSDLPEEMQSEIDNMMSEYDFDDFEMKSFVSEQNNDQIESVQFTLQTKKIEMQEPEEEPEQTNEDQSIWDRFLNLF
ncbi:YhgE/Pip domain-containing protein [Alkalibacillus sp. S2W]|uniref:YhgE/Pip domain-containing protein n=1 Tax=Alkalibacillus sp. S2W TaxID=3386553 RepID=UPI00398CE792